MKRVYELILSQHLDRYRQMVFLSGPRQVGKTTTSLEASEEKPLHYYFNWGTIPKVLGVSSPSGQRRPSSLDYRGAQGYRYSLSS